MTLSCQTYPLRSVEQEGRGAVPLAIVAKGYVPPTDMVRVGTLKISVTDTGAGISVDNQSKLFGQFQKFNAKDLQGGGGSGLGLWLSRKIVELHGGEMGFASEGEGCGTMFYVALPTYRVNRRLLDVPEMSASTATRRPCVVLTRVHPSCTGTVPDTVRASQ